MLQPALDLAPIQARWTAATPGDWIWLDELGEVPYQRAWQNDHGRILTSNEPRAENDTATSGNDGSLGIVGLFVDPAFFAADDDDGDDLVPIFMSAVKAYDAWSRLVRNDDRDWRGPIEISNPADLIFILHAKADVAALIAEVERLRALLPPA